MKKINIVLAYKKAYKKVDDMPMSIATKGWYDLIKPVRNIVKFPLRNELINEMNERWN